MTNVASLALWETWALAGGLLQSKTLLSSQRTPYFKEGGASQEPLESFFRLLMF